MKAFLVEKRRMYELGLMLLLDLIIFLIWDSMAMVCLFSFGFIWNWSAAQDLGLLLINPRYRLSMVRFVGNVQAMILKPFLRFPIFIQTIVKSTPAGIFWGMVIIMNNSTMPWWMTFVGSFVFELFQFWRPASLKEELP